jgi:hypothetical protein
MKRYIHSLLTLCAVIIATSAMPQSLQIFDKSGNYLPNDTNIYIWGDSSYSTTMGVKFDVKNISCCSVSMKVKKIETSLLPGTSNTFCFNGHCYFSSVYVSPDPPATIAIGATDTSFSGDYRPKGHLGESIITYVFFNVNNVNDSAGVVVHFNATPTVINETVIAKAEVSNPYPNPAINYTSFKYRFPENTIHAQFILRDILGFPVKEIEIDNPEGKLLINTTDIKSGIYFYSFYVDDKLILTKKLIVR